MHVSNKAGPCDRWVKARQRFISKEGIRGNHFLKMIGRALMLIFTTSKPFLPCNAIGIMLKFRNYW